MRKPIYIGIDPAFRKSGIGFCELHNKLVRFKPYSVNELLTDIVKGVFNNCVVCVENSNLTNTTFSPKGNGAKYQARISRDVGKNQALSQIIVDMLKFRCLKVIEVSPKEKGAKDISHSVMEGICKRSRWELKEKRTNQDKRDAFKLMLIAKNRYEKRQ